MQDPFKKEVILIIPREQWENKIIPWYQLVQSLIFLTKEKPLPGTHYLCPTEGSYLNLLKIKWVIKFFLNDLQKSVEIAMRTISNIIGLLYS